ncbi:hypothetical protein [Streptomyces sp. NPDC026673]|uniref:hypothetical protein n=1 Tax=Streptomyces sp. NPDC026673 TaxID=3155724 RepID=UPI0033D2F622
MTSATVRIHDRSRSNGRAYAGGMWLRGLCRDCNSFAGANYDAAYADFTMALETYTRARQRLHLPGEPAPPIRLAPGRVARSILIGMFATTPHLRVMFPGLADDLRERRDHITMPDGATLRLGLHRSRGTRLASMFNGHRVLKYRQYYDVFSEVYFRPLAWALTPSDRWDDESAGESVFDQQRWATVNDWLQYGDDVTATDLRNLCPRGVPLVHHPLLGGRNEEWIEFLSDEVTAIVEGEIPV